MAAIRFKASQLKPDPDEARFKQEEVSIKRCGKCGDKKPR